MIKEGILQNKSNLSPQLRLIIVFNITAINQNLPSLKLIKTQEKIDNRGLARASRANKGNRLAFFDRKGDVLQNITLPIIRKGNMLEFDAAILDLQVLVSLLRLIICAIHDFKNPLRSNHRCLQNRVILHNINQRIKKLIDILDKGIHNTSRNSRHLPSQAKVSQNHSISQDFQQRHGRPQKETIDIEIAIGEA